jgi:hypothetical protein
MIEGSCLCGQVRWSFGGIPESATACNCTACRRYGALWIYGYEGEEIALTGSTAAFRRGDRVLEFLFCAACGSLAAWRGLRRNEDGRLRMAVNVRLAEPEAVAALPIDHFDGLDTFDDLGRDGRCVKVMWF